MSFDTLYLISTPSRYYSLSAYIKFKIVICTSLYHFLSKCPPIIIKLRFKWPNANQRTSPKNRTCERLEMIGFVNVKLLREHSVMRKHANA